MRNNSIKGFSSDVLTFDKNGKQTLIKRFSERRNVEQGYSSENHDGEWFYSKHQ